MKYKFLVCLFLVVVIQINAQTIVDCSAGSLDVSYCYGNNDSNQFVYTSSDGSSLRLTINSGFIEGAPFDFLVILDSDGVTELYNGEGNNGSLEGLFFQSTGDTIYFQVSSDASISCASGNITVGIDYNVTCSTCANPEATFEVVDDCDNGDQFSININVTSLGDASSLTIANSANSNSTSVLSLGTYQIGPFSNLDQVTVTLLNDQDSNCSLSSETLTFSICPPENDDPCNAIVMSGSTDDQCNLIASGTINGATDSGLINPVCVTNANDDVWFQFTAQAESQIVSVQNVTSGTFNIDHAIYEGSCDALNELYCSENPNSVATQLTIGNTYFIRVFSAGLEPETSNFDICLKDAPSNIICEEAVPFCIENGTLILDNTTGIGGLNDIACLASSPNPKWSVIQIGEPGSIEIEIVQTEANGSFLDVDFVVWGPFVDVEDGCSALDYGCPTASDCPNNTTNPNFYPSGNIVDCSYSFAPIENFSIENALSGEIYILLVTNFSNQPGIISITQTNLNQSQAGSLTAEVEANLGPDLNICQSENNSVILESESIFADNYEWFLDGLIVASGPDLLEYTATESGEYTVFVYNENCNVVAQDSIVVTFVDCDNVGLINVNAFFDANSNGVYDSDENAFTNGYFTYEINDDTVLNSVSSNTGSFNLASVVETDSYTFNYYFYDDYENCYNVSIPVFENISVLAGEVVTIEFPVIEEQPCEDIAIYLINQQAPRPGFFHTNYLVIDNLGLTTSSGSVEYTVDPELLISAFTTAGNYTVTLTGNGFTLDFVNLLPGEAIQVSIILQTLATTEIGGTVTNVASYVTNNNDLVSDNDSSSVTELVIGSYDPNDKMESQGRFIVYDDFLNSEEYLYYTIRFQNLGTAAAEFIRIEDVLDPKLDETTFQMLRSSHDYVVTRTDRDLEWFFDDINLPAEQDDAEGSNGFVYFRIKPKAGYALGDVIPNTAAIFFDFNAPVITNRFETEFVEETLSLSEFDSNGFNMYPNPANNVLHIKLNSITNANLSIYDIQGKLVLEQNMSQEQNLELNVSELQSGLYFVKLNTGSKELIKKLIIE